MRDLEVSASAQEAKAGDPQYLEGVGGPPGGGRHRRRRPAERPVIQGSAFHKRSSEERNRA